MALQQESAETREAREQGDTKRSKKDEGFRGHLSAFLVTGLFLFSLNVLTSFGDWWFYWPLFFWGWALVMHAVATYGADTPARVLDDLRSVIPGLSSSRSRSAKARRTNAAPFAATAFASVHERIERLKGTVWQIPEGPVRDQALRISAAAERIAGVMAADRSDAAMVEWFDTLLLAPTESLLAGYARLANRNVAGAGETLRRVEERNLPLLEDRFNALYDQLHRGEIVDLAVASEMLDLDPPELPHARSRQVGETASRQVSRES